MKKKTIYMVESIGVNDSFHAVYALEIEAEPFDIEEGLLIFRNDKYNSKCRILGTFPANQFIAYIKEDG